MPSLHQREDKEHSLASPEASYVAQLIRCYLAGEQSAPRPPQELDWSYLSRLLAEHMITTTVAPLLIRGLAPRVASDELAKLDLRLRRRGADRRRSRMDRQR